MLHYQFLAGWLKSHTKTERGASLVEYALLVSLIAVVCIGAVTLLGEAADSQFTSVADELTPTPATP